MKRKVFIIAALSLVFALSAALLAGCSSVKEKSDFSVIPASEEYKEEVMSSSAAYEYLQWLSSDEMHSRYGSVDLDELSINHGVGKAAFNIAAKMEEMGYETFEGAYIEVDKDGVLAASGEKVTGLMRFETSTGQAGVNVIYRKKATNGSRGQVILTAHFDNLFGRALSGGTVITAEGAYENGAAVATLLYVAQLLQEVETQYDIVFAFLGSSVVTANNTIYYCWDGAKALLSQLPELYGGEYEPVLNINLHRLGGGENLYMYSSDRPTSYNNYFYAAAEADGLNFSAPPAYKHAFSEALSMQIMPSSPSGVYHPGLLTDSIHFINAGIPTLTYLSLDWESGMETANPDSPDLAYTGRDTIENMNMGRGGEQAVKERHGDGESRLSRPCLYGQRHDREHEHGQRRRAGGERAAQQRGAQHHHFRHGSKLRPLRAGDLDGERRAGRERRRRLRAFGGVNGAHLGARDRAFGGGGDPARQERDQDDHAPQTRALFATGGSIRRIQQERRSVRGVRQR